MKSKETFEKLRREKTGWFNLNTRLTIAVGIVVLISILLSFAISWVLKAFFPFISKIPLFIQINVYSIIFAMVSVHILSKLFFDPIRDLRNGMQRVSDGDFDIRLTTESSSTEIQQMIAGFNMMAHELSSTEILQSDFVSNVSHEIKTPINAIEGYTTLLQDCDNLNDEQKEYVKKIIFNTKRLSTLVGNILLLSKTENQSIETHKKKYRLDEQIRQSIVALESAWEEKNIEFDVSMDCVEYIGNEPLMRHVWSNLIGNAIKFNPYGGIIKIRLFEKEQKVIFTIDDCGPGVSEKMKNHIFDKFYQEDTSHKSEGNGLGLALVKRILDISSGEIIVQNLESGGCRFTVFLEKTKILNDC